MNKEEVTLIAAIIAAVTSIFSLFVSNRSKYLAELRASQRSSLEKVITALGNGLYATVAMSKRMGLAESDEAYKKHKITVTESVRVIDQLRRETRYFLWGLNDGIHTMVMIPKYVEYLRGDNDAVSELIEQATQLREALDSAIRFSYQQGNPPAKKYISRVQIESNKLNQLYKANKG